MCLRYYQKLQSVQQILCQSEYSNNYIRMNEHKQKELQLWGSKLDNPQLQGSQTHSYKRLYESSTSLPANTVANTTVGAAAGQSYSGGNVNCPNCPDVFCLDACCQLCQWLYEGCAQFCGVFRNACGTVCHNCAQSCPACSCECELANWCTCCTCDIQCGPCIERACGNICSCVGSCLQGLLGSCHNSNCICI